MILSYINSQGKEFNLVSSGLMRIKSANFHSYEWKIEGRAQQFGIEIDRFTKNPYEYKATIEFKGDEKERKKLINSFHEAMESDIIARIPGMVQWGDYYINCYIISTDTYPDKSCNKTLNDIIIFAPYPFWVQHLKRQFLLQSRSEEQEGFDFPTNFEFDFAADELGHETWNVDHYTSSHFQMYIYGPCENPRVYVNEYPYQINTVLEENEYLIIDSRKHTVIKYLSNGTVENIYNSRDFAYSVFEMIPSGKLNINWSGNFGFDIILFLERSEPKW